MKNAVLILVVLLVGLLCASAPAQEPPYDFYNPPPAYFVPESPNDDGELRFKVNGVISAHGTVGSLLEVWAKSREEAAVKAALMLAVTPEKPGIVICANGQRLKVYALEISSSGEWRVGVQPKKYEAYTRKPSQYPFTKEDWKRLATPGWTLDCRDRVDIPKDYVEPAGYVWQDRLWSSRQWEKYLKSIGKE